MIAAVEFDFANKIDRSFEFDHADGLSAIRDSIASGKFCWIDFSAEHVEDSLPFLQQLGIEPADLAELKQDRPVPYFIDLDDCLFFTLLDGSWDSGLTHCPIAVFVGTTFFVTVHREESSVITAMRRDYSRNFRRIALSPGFLLYELADHLCEEYTEIVCQIAEDTENVEESLFRHADESMFHRVAELIRGIVEFYKVVVFAREVIHDLSTSRSPFIPETTQPYLEKKATLLDRLSADISAEREVLSEAVNLYLGIVTHGTNRFLARLTALGTLFLPLSFLAGVYGMNFKYLPELEWHYAYPTFWGIVLTFASGVLLLMKKKGWL